MLNSLPVDRNPDGDIPGQFDSVTDSVPSLAPGDELLQAEPRPERSLDCKLAPGALSSVKKGCGSLPTKPALYNAPGISGVLPGRTSGEPGERFTRCDD